MRRTGHEVNDEPLLLVQVVVGHVSTFANETTDDDDKSSQYNRKYINKNFKI